MLFVGEKRSDTAKRMGVTWEDGRLATKQLFDALRDNGVDPVQGICGHQDGTFVGVRKWAPVGVYAIRCKEWQMVHRVSY